MAPSMAPISLLLVLLLCPAVLLACPASCRCGAANGGYEVRCSGAAMGTVPGGIPSQTTALWITGTAMTAIEGNKFSGLSSLRKLYVLDNKKLTEIYLSAFNGLTNLKELHMTGNQFKFVQPGTFYGLTNLKILNLSGNIWSIAIATMFSGLPSLTTLNLSKNNITNMGDGPFSATLKALEVLDISSNKLSNNIDVKIFSSWDSLQEVDMSGNLLQQPPVAHLEQVKNLKTLDVSRNPIKSLQENAFSRIKSLEALKVNSMVDLGTVQNNAFGELYNLRRFEFMDNKVINEFTLKHLPAHLNALEEVNLSNNTFKTLDGDLFINRPNLTSLILNDLPLHCDCKLSWMGEALSNTTRWPWAGVWKGLNATNGTDGNSTMENSPVCATPQNLEEVKVGMMMQEDFTCDKAMFYNISTVNETTTNLTNTLTIKANLHPGLPSSLWLHPQGWYLRGNDTIENNFTATETVDEDSHQVVAALIIANVTVDDLGNYTLIATNAAGNSTQNFLVQLEDDSVLRPTGPISGFKPVKSMPAMLLVVFLICMSKLFV